MPVQPHFPKVWAAFRGDPEAMARLKEGIKFDALWRMAELVHNGEISAAREHLMRQPVFYYGKRGPEWISELKPPKFDISDFPDSQRKDTGHD
jgi:hypothetical protein